MNMLTQKLIAENTTLRQKIDALLAVVETAKAMRDNEDFILFGDVAEAAGRTKCERTDCPYHGKARSTSCQCFNYHVWDIKKFHDAANWSVVLAMIDVIEAAKRVRSNTRIPGDTVTECKVPDCLCHSGADFDAALAKYEELKNAYIRRDVS